jgi:hypothetical protein
MSAPYNLKLSKAKSTPSVLNLTTTEAVRSQHIYLNWDVVDYSMLNSNKMWNWGSTIAAHYLARHLGLDAVQAGCDDAETYLATGNATRNDGNWNWYIASGTGCWSA